ncbi:MAG: FprA family A-type flavoprotein [Candidatus Omnitrophica bacterium]|nr:FprA family A-type flavoprotein [Candidatus Omnitrophota bacterium]
MKAIEIKKGVYWVGAIDRKIREFHGYKTHLGTTYNAYLVVDDRTALIDTVKEHLFDEMLERIKDVIDPKQIDLIISNHSEMDHSGSILKMLPHTPKASLLTSPNGESILEKHFGKIPALKKIDPASGTKLGKRTLNFALMPMVHWPDSMATYIPEEKLLLPNDAFGQHIASHERFDDELGWNIVREEAAKYYANIVMPYGTQVSKALDTLEGLDIDMIAPSHGVILRSHIKDMKAEYRKWSGNITEKKAVIVYETMWGSTEKMANEIRGAFEEKGIPVDMMDLVTDDISDVMTRILEAEYICVGSPTLNNNMMPKVSAFLTYLKGLALKNRKAMAFGSYGWGGQSVGQVEGILKECGFDMMESVKAQYVPDKEQLEGIRKKFEGHISGS